MGSQSKLTRILGLAGYRVTGFEQEGDDPRARITLFIERVGRRRCWSGCGRWCSRLRDSKGRSWNDLPWGAHPVTLVGLQWRVDCPRCGVHTELLPFAAPRARVTRRLQQHIGLDCQSMPTSHAAVRHHVSWGKARRAEKAFLASWDAARPKYRPRYLGADEVQRGKGQQYWTVLSDLVRGEVIGLARDRTEEALAGLLRGKLDAHQRTAVEAVCTDTHRGHRNAVASVLPNAEVVFAWRGSGW